MLRVNAIEPDAKSKELLRTLKAHYQNMDKVLTELELESPAANRARSLAVTKMEESFLWATRAVDQHQIDARGVDLGNIKRD